MRRKIKNRKGSARGESDGRLTVEAMAEKQQEDPNEAANSGEGY